jgi:hypothetical protein
MIMMPLVEIVSIIVGSGIILNLIGLITADGLGKKEKIKHISVVNKKWQKIKVVSR